MRIKREKETREKLMDDIQDFQKELKGKNRHTALRFDEGTLEDETVSGCITDSLNSKTRTKG